MMPRRISFLLTCCACFVCAPALAGDFSAVRAGPAQNPHSFPDYGGTPDLTVSNEVGLRETEIENLLSQIKSADGAVRWQAVTILRQNAPGGEQAIKNVLWRAHGAENGEMQRAMTAARNRAQKSSLLDSLAALNPEGSRGIVGALRVLSLLYALSDLDTLVAYKIMIEFSPRYAGIYRQEIGRLLISHGLSAMPALVYSRSHQSSDVRAFAVKLILDLGDPALSEQVKIQNPRRLAQLLEAHAAINDIDSIEMTLSFVNHPSFFVRAAARSCIQKYGNNAKWPAYRLFENTLFKQPAKDATASQILSELYRHFDEKRLAPMMPIFETGKKHFLKKQFSAMEKAYLTVLHREPMFPLRREMAEDFFSYGLLLIDKGKTAEARQKLNLAESLAQTATETAKKIRAELDWLDAEALRQAGLANLSLYRLVLQNNPRHEGALKWASILSGKRAPATTIVTKALIIAFFVFLGGTILLFKVHPRRPR